MRAKNFKHFYSHKKLPFWLRQGFATLCSILIFVAAVGVAPLAISQFKSENASAESVTFAWLQPASVYEEKLAGKNDAEVLASQELKLALLQRTFVNRVGYEKLVNFAAQSDDNTKVLQWLFTDFNRLEAYLLGGTPEGGEGKYIESLNALSQVYAKHSADLTNAVNGPVFQKMMMAISLAYGSPVNGWQTADIKKYPEHVTHERTPSEPVRRYEVIKQLLTETITHDEVSTSFDSATFRDLEIEEMRWVVNNRISDNEIPWLNWYTQKVKSGATGYGKEGYMNPYNYIYYDGSFKWFYEDPQYYVKDSQYCALDKGNLNKNHSTDYARGANCNEKYGLEYFDLETTEKSPLRLWTIWEEDGVCGSIAGVGTNIQMAYGIPSSLVSQPGHAAFFASSQKEFKGETLRFWTIDNSCASWANSYKGERMPLNWGTRGNKTWTDSNNASYLLAAQRALDHFADYRNSFYYNLLADTHATTEEKIASYSGAIQAMGYNVDSWYNLIQVLLKQDEGNFEDQEVMAKYQKLAEAIMTHMKEFPLPMYDLLKLIVDKVGIYQVAYVHHLDATLDELLNTKVDGKDINNQTYFQAQAIRDIATYILGRTGDTDIAEFSFDGDHAMQLRLKNGAREAESPFEYSYQTDLSQYGDKDLITDNDHWHTVTDKTVDVSLADHLDEINDTNDILVHLQGTPRTKENIFRVDLTPGKADEIQVNELERRIAGADPQKAEWIEVDMDEDPESYMTLLMSQYDPYEANKLDWKKLSEAEPVIRDTSNKNDFDLWFRYGYTGTNTPSSPECIGYNDKPADNPQSSYISSSQLHVASSLEDQSKDATLKNLLDNDHLSYWQNDPKDERRVLTYELNTPVQLTKLEYIIQQATNPSWGNIIKAQLETSLDGENYQVVDDNIDWPWQQDVEKHTYNLSEPVYAKYIRITPLQVYNNNSNVRVSMFNFYQNKETKTKLSDLGPLATLTASEYTYDGTAKQPTVTIGDYNNTTLIPNQDYTVEYLNNTNAGTAKVKLTGAGDRYTGELVKEFTINQAEAPFTQPQESYEIPANGTLASAELPADWEWADPNLAIQPGETTTATVVYKGADAANFKNTTRYVQLSRATSTPTNPGGDSGQSTHPQPGTPGDGSSTSGDSSGTSGDGSGTSGGSSGSSSSTPTPSHPSTPGDSSGASSDTPAPSYPSTSGGQNVPAGPGDIDYTTPGSAQIAQNNSTRSNPISVSMTASDADPTSGASADGNNSDSATNDTATDDEALTDGPLKDGARDSDNTSATKAEDEAIDQELDSEDNGMVLYVVIGAILVLALLAGLFIYFRHRNHR